MTSVSLRLTRQCSFYTNRKYHKRYYMFQARSEIKESRTVGLGLPTQPVSLKSKHRWNFVSKSSVGFGYSREEGFPDSW